jgi:hypothetical protein
VARHEAPAQAPKRLRHGGHLGTPIAFANVVAGRPLGVHRVPEADAPAERVRQPCVAEKPRLVELHDIDAHGDHLGNQIENLATAVPDEVHAGVVGGTHGAGETGRVEIAEARGRDGELCLQPEVLPGHERVHAADLRVGPDRRDAEIRQAIQQLLEACALHARSQQQRLETHQRAQPLEQQHGIARDDVLAGGASALHVRRDPLETFRGGDFGESVVTEAREVRERMLDDAVEEALRDLVTHAPGVAVGSAGPPFRSGLAAVEQALELGELEEVAAQRFREAVRNPGRPRELDGALHDVPTRRTVGRRLRRERRRQPAVELGAHAAIIRPATPLERR